MTYADQQAQRIAYTGYLAENFVQTEIGARLNQPTYGWSGARVEGVFLLRDRDGAIMPVEVKSGIRTRAQSACVHTSTYAPRRAVKLAGSAGGTDGIVETWPLYDAAFLAQL